MTHSKMSHTRYGVASPAIATSQTSLPGCCVAVIGGGFSGTMAAIHLRRLLPQEQKVLLIERSGHFARGLAYADTGAAHLLNVRAANMSAFPDDAQHYERWLETVAPHVATEIHRTAAGIFTTRRLYGRYLRATLAEEMKRSGGMVRLVADEVTSLTPAPGGWRLSCRSGKDILAAGAVLACGNLPALRPSDSVAVRNPWSSEALSNLRPDEPVLIIGTGLTMADLVLALHTQGFRGPVFALSRRGKLPHRHEAIGQTWPTSNFTAAERGTTLALLQAVRRQLHTAQAAGISWRAVIDSLRPITAELWHGLNVVERARFLRHLRPYWDIHRHRMAPPAAEIVDALTSSGALRIIRGRIRNIQYASDHATMTFARHGSPQAETLQAQRIIFATGLEGTLANTGLPASLLAQGLVRLDQHSLGLEVTESLAVIGADGSPAPNLWALGPLVRGVFWECLAVPDIRVQAERLAQAIAPVISPASLAYGK
ncbi:MAG: FAD/NAD(P)-binding protein [Acidocella sp.]